MALDAWTLPPPNIRSMLVPDPGYVLIEADLSGADLQVVAWDAAPTGRTRLKERLRAKEDIHSANARWLFGADCAVRDLHSIGMSFRDCAKRAVHAGDYDTTPRTLASAIGIPIKTAEEYLHWWCEVENPEIGAWKKRIRQSLWSRRMPVIHNAFGFRRMYTDRPDRLLGQALAWIAQSTVSLVINHALVRIDAELCEGTNWGCQLLGTFCSDIHESLQVHDSILLQAPTEVWPDIAGAVLDRMTVEVPYADPLVIPSELKWSSEDWGHMQKWQ